MALKTFKPITPSLRQLVIVDRAELYRGKPVKALTEGKTSAGGRNNTGRVTVRFRGADTSRPIVSLISSAVRSSVRPVRSSGSNMIRTAPRLSR